MKNIDSAFKHVRIFTIAIVCCCTILCVYTLYQCYSLSEKAQNHIYILAGGKALEAFSAERKDNIPVEAKDHIRMFHHYFFTLDPDDKVIKGNISNALYLADGTAKLQYDNLKENGYYSSLISGNISQQVQADSIVVDISSYPYRFRYYGTEKIIRPTSVNTRSLITEGQLRNVSRSDNNPHGFLIEKWMIIDNKDINTQNR